MKKIITAFCLTIISSVFALAQTNTSSGDYKKAEFFVGYSNGQSDTGVDAETNTDAFVDRSTFHGFNVSGVANVNRYFGIKGDVSGTYRSDDVSFAVTTGGTTENVNFRAKRSLYNFLGGVQFKDNASTARIKPFGYALVGAGYARVKVTSVNCPPFTGVNCVDFRGNSETGLAGAFGGGLDVKINDRFDFRVIKVDYNPMRFEGVTQHNVRFGIGFVFK